MQALHYVSPKKLEWRETPDPEIKGADDALLKPLAVSMCDLDHNIVRGLSPFPGPFILGHEFVAEVLAVGDAVKSIATGDVVLASFQPSCGHCGACHERHSSVCRKVPPTSMYGIGVTGGDWGGAMADAIRVPWADFNLRRLPTSVDARTFAPASDNLADALRCLEYPLARKPNASVLIAGAGSIPLYAVAIAKHLGAAEVSFASKDLHSLKIAERCGADVVEIADWPRKLGSFDVTVDCTNDESGLQAVIRSTAPFGYCTSASIYFTPGTPVPLGDMYMKGIEFHTGRVDSASQLDKVIDLVASGLNPDLIEPQYIPRTEAVDALLSGNVSQKLIFES